MLKTYFQEKKRQKMTKQQLAALVAKQEMKSKSQHDGLHDLELTHSLESKKQDHSRETHYGKHTNWIVAKYHY